MCLKCSDNYTRQGDKCNLCETPGKQIFYMIGSVIVGILMFTYLIYKTIKGKGNSKKISSGILKIVLRQFQLLGIISQFPMSWSDEIKAMFSTFNTISNAGTAAFSVDCFQSSSYAVTSLLNLLVPLFIIGFFISIIKCNYQNRLNSTERKRYMILSSIVILLTLHPTLVKQVLAFFKCSNLILGSTYLLADIDIKCGSSDHNVMLLGLGIPALIIYILGIPTFAGIYLYSKRSELDEGK